MLNRAFGCELAFAEMISARALAFHSKKTKEMLSSAPKDRPLGIQLLGNDPEIVRKAMGIVQENEFDLIDFNAACPVKKVTARGEGGSLLKDPGKLKELLKVLVKNSEAPVTLKMRTGWDEASVNAVETALLAQDAGVKALFLHGRTCAQGYSGTVDYRTIRRVKEAVEIPVIGSGNALSPQLIKKMFDETGSDGVAIARGAFGNPWLFRETAEFLKTGILPAGPDIDELADTMIAHLNLYADYYGGRSGTIVFRKFFCWYTRGLRDMKTLKEKAFRTETIEQMTGLINELRTCGKQNPTP